MIFLKVVYYWFLKRYFYSIRGFLSSTLRLLRNSCFNNTDWQIDKYVKECLYIILVFNIIIIISESLSQYLNLSLQLKTIHSRNKQILHFWNFFLLKLLPVAKIKNGIKHVINYNLVFIDPLLFIFSVINFIISYLFIFETWIVT